MWWILNLARAACTFDASPAALDEAMDRALQSHTDGDDPWPTSPLLGSPCP